MSIVARLGIGTVSLGMDYGLGPASHQPDAEQGIDVLRHAAVQGIHFYDTAPAYGDAERLVGQVLGTQTNCVIATKITVRGDVVDPARLEESLRKSCEVLRRNPLDVLQVHNASSALIARGQVGGWLRKQQQLGTILRTGATVYGEPDALSAISSGHFDVLQVAYNILDQRMADQVFAAAQKHGVQIVVRSAYLKGALTEKAEFLPEKLQPLRAAVEQVRKHFAIGWADLPALALRFCLSHPAVSHVLVGVRTRAEVDAAVTAASLGLLDPVEVRRAHSLAIYEERLLNPSYWES